MKGRRVSLVAAFIFAATAAWAIEPPNTLTDAERAAGWRLLFDGKSTAGWVSAGQTKLVGGWVAKDGALVRVEKSSDLVTTDSFTDFELTWDWKIAPAGNSGLKYNLVDVAKGLGFEYQLIDDVGHPDGIKGGRLHQTAGLYDLVEPPEDKKLNPPGEWNSSRLLVNGRHVEQWLNGRKTVEFEMGSDDLTGRIARSKYAKIPRFGEKTSSPILLQEHGAEIAVRSMKIRELPAR